MVCQIKIEAEHKEGVLNGLNTALKLLEDDETKFVGEYQDHKLNLDVETNEEIETHNNILKWARWENEHKQGK